MISVDGNHLSGQGESMKNTYVCQTKGLGTVTANSLSEAASVFANRMASKIHGAHAKVERVAFKMSSASESRFSVYAVGQRFAGEFLVCVRAV